MDEGTLGQSAERVLHGELPHRDFDDVYTGGLAEFDAVVFRVLGTRLIALRIAMFAVFLLWVPAVYYIATRFARPVAAAAVTLLCVVWTLATNPSAMPSSYNLFLATFGTVALIRFTETRRVYWVMAAGLAGGASIAVKVVGLYYIAAAVLFLAFDEQQTAATQPHPEFVAARRHWGYALLVTVASALFVATLIRLVHDIPRASRLLHFVLPSAMLLGVLAGAEWRHTVAGPGITRLRRLGGLLGPFTLGVTIPLALFIAPYIASGSVGAVLQGVFGEPLKRFHYAVVPPASLNTLGAALPWVLVLIPPRASTGRARDRADSIALAVLTASLAILALATVHGGIPYVVVWLTVCYVAPCTVAAGCLLLATENARARIPRPRREQLWLLLCMTAMCSLVQVPLANWGYILYFAPLATLALLAIVTTQPGGPGLRPAIAAGFFLAFGVAAVNPNHVALWKGSYLAPDAWPQVPLAIERTGVKVSAVEARSYERIIQLLDMHSPPGAFIYAGPDSPQMYFLAQRRNPTRTLFDFFDDTAGRDARLIRTIDSLRVGAIALNNKPIFSSPIDATLGGALRVRFPDSAVVDNFTVRWRSGS